MFFMFGLFLKEEFYGSMIVYKASLVETLHKQANTKWGPEMKSFYKQVCLT
jgi:hypothetical protein